MRGWPRATAWEFIWRINGGKKSQATRNQHPLHFARAFINLRNARISIMPLDRIVFKKPIAAVNFNFIGEQPTALCTLISVEHDAQPAAISSTRIM